MTNEEILTVRLACSIPLDDTPNSEWEKGDLIWSPVEGEGIVLDVVRFGSIYRREIVSLSVVWLRDNLAEKFHVGSDYSSDLRRLPRLTGDRS